MARVLAEQREPELDRILTRGLSQLVDHHLLGKRHVRVLDGSPPQHRHADCRPRPAYLCIGEIVLLGGAAPGRRRIDAVLDQYGLERRADEDRLADDTLAESDLAVLADACT